MNSTALLNLLYDKHVDDVFVPECKDGPTWGRNHNRLDAWVLKRSWSKFELIGYEIKVSKSDFRSDAKYVNYLPMCNSLYFVCPWNMIQVSEIPLDVGLIYCSKNETRLITRKKAAYRDIEHPIETLYYILMSRTKIVDNSSPRTSLEQWKDFIDGKVDAERIGRQASKKIRKDIDEQIDIVREENRNLKYENERLLNRIKSIEYAENVLTEMGINTKNYDFVNFRERGISATINSLCSDYSKDVCASLRNIESSISTIKQRLNINER